MARLTVLFALLGLVGWILVATLTRLSDCGIHPMAD
ncbi:hypothetical protein P3T23_006820 [Paraburkholderia sp. GAS448]